MSDDSEQVTALIKELLILNRAESTPALEPPTVKEVEGRKSKRKRIRQELVQVLYLCDRKTLEPDKTHLSFAKILSGLNVFEISNLQEQETESRYPGGM